jgi:hypothetical protein
MTFGVEPFTIDVSQDVLDNLQARLKRTRWPGSVPGTGWSRGVDLDSMRDLTDMSVSLDQSGFIHA